MLMSIMNVKSDCCTNACFLLLFDRYKMTKPGYQPITKDQIPTVNLPLGETDETKIVANARLIAGELGEIKGAAKTFSPVQMWDVNLPIGKGTTVDLPFPSDHTCIVFVRRGSVAVIGGDDVDGGNAQESKLGPQDVALMKMDGSSMLRLKVLEKNSSVLILGGEPIDEPIAARGPFVMNTEEELQKAVLDYRSGKMGQ